MHIRDHLLLEAAQCPSPNRDNRPAGTDIELIVIHGISLPPGQFGSGDITALFCNRLNPEAHPDYEQLCRQKLSSHLLIDRRGTCTQYVPFNERAWHAGVSAWQGREHCNDFSIGIELEGMDDTPYAAAQYAALAAAITAIRRSYPGICAEALVGHCDIAPGRKTDPGPAFDWHHLRGLLG